MPSPEDVLAVDALDVVADADELHAVRHAALFDPLPCRRGTGRKCEETTKEHKTRHICIDYYLIPVSQDAVP